MTCILGGELEKGFLLMHAAMEEDKTTFGANYTTAPANAFVTLDYQKIDQWFHDEVKDLAEFLDSAIQEYNKRHATTSLQLDEFKRKFLQRGGDMQDVVFYFVYTLSRMKYIASNVEDPLTKTDFGSLAELQILFDLCQVLDCTIAELHSLQRNAKGDSYGLKERIQLLSGKVPSLGLDGNKLGQVNRYFNRDMSTALDDLVKGTFRFKGNVSPIRPTPIQEDFAISYGLRNSAAHNIKHSKVVYANYRTICSRVLNTIFYTVVNAK